MNVSQHFARRTSRQGSAGEHSVLRFEMSHVRALEHNCDSLEREDGQ